MFDHTADAVTADRRRFIGGSDARTIMGDDQAALERLWRATDPRHQEQPDRGRREAD